MAMRTKRIGWIFTVFLTIMLSSPLDSSEASRLVERTYPLQLKTEVPDFGPDGLKGLNENQKKRLFSGEVVMVSSPETTPEGRAMISAALLIAVPVERAWSVLAATEKQMEYIEEIESLKILEKGLDYNRMEFRVKIMGKTVGYTVIHHFAPEIYYFWWELDPSADNDLKELYGFWKLYEAGESRTVARYGSYVRPAFPAPAFIRNWLYKTNVHASLEKVKKFVEEEASR